MVDIAELGFAVDSSGLEKGSRALDEAAAKSEKVAGAAAKLEIDYSRMSKSVEDGTRQISAGVGGMAGSLTAMASELQGISRGQIEFIGIAGQMRDLLTSMESKFSGVAAASAKHAGEAAKSAAGMEAQASAAAKLESELANQDARLRVVAQRGVEFAESMRGANLSERSLAEAAREAAAGIDVKAQVMARAGTEQERMAARAQTLMQAEARAAAETEKAARAHALQELNLKKLLAQIDPTIARLDRLAHMEGQLEKALDLGAINPEIFDQYQAKIDKTRAATLNAGRASDVMTKSLGGLNLQSVETQQSVAALARALATGQWGQAQASITSLTARTGVMGGAFSATGLAIGGTGAAIGAFTIMAAKGYIESRKLEGVIIGMGGASGMTTGEVANLRNEIGAATRDYAGATQAINQLLLSGKLTGDMLESVARSSAGLTKLTGQSITSVASEIESLATGGEDALIKLNEKYGFLTEATSRQIQAIREEKGDVAALSAALAELEREQARRVDEMVKGAGLLERAWGGVKGAVLDTLQAIKDVGRQDAEYQLQRSIAQLNNVRMQVGGQDPETVLGYRMAREEVQRALLAVMELDAKEDERARKRKADAAAIAADQDRRKSEADAAADIDRQLQTVYGLDTAVNRLEMSFAAMSEERQKAMIADGRYQALLNRAMEEDAKRNERRTKATRDRVSEEERAFQRLQQQYSQSEASLTRSIALHGQVGRAAAMAYDTAHGALKALSDTQKSILMELSQWLDWMDEMAALNGVWDDIRRDHDKAMSKGKDQADEMSEYARQAARNMQSHFADFLFDPFENGLKGMAEGFSNTLRRMLAEAAAAKFFEMIGGAMSSYSGSGSGWINAIGGIISGGDGKREYGGPVSGSGMYQVGERNKPELLSTPNGQYLIPGDGGRVDPIRAAPASSGGMRTPQINISVIGNAQVESATANQNSSGGFDVEVILKQIEGGMAGNVAGGASPINRAIESRYGLKAAV